VIVATLTGLGPNGGALTDAVNLSTHIDDICGELLWNDLSEVVLCGHSYGGMIITGVAERHADRIRSIVYLDAFLPKDGQSLDDILARPQPSPDIVPTRTAISMVNEVDAPWVQSKITPQPGATFREKLKVTGAVARLSRRTYVRATKFPIGAFDASYELARSDKDWTALALNCNHDTMLDEPETTAQILMDAI
jgi:pimeloyl-ACP methyl ester carboxylesterase